MAVDGSVGKLDTLLASWTPCWQAGHPVGKLDTRGPRAIEPTVVKLTLAVLGQESTWPPGLPDAPGADTATFDIHLDKPQLARVASRHSAERLGRHDHEVIGSAASGAAPGPVRQAPAPPRPPHGQGPRPRLARSHAWLRMPTPRTSTAFMIDPCPSVLIKTLRLGTDWPKSASAASAASHTLGRVAPRNAAAGPCQPAGGDLVEPQQRRLDGRLF